MAGQIARHQSLKTGIAPDVEVPGRAALDGGMAAVYDTECYRHSRSNYRSDLSSAINGRQRSERTLVDN